MTLQEDVTIKLTQKYRDFAQNMPVISIEGRYSVTIMSIVKVYR